MYIFGASGHGKVIIESLESHNISVEGIYDDDSSIKSLMGYKVLSKLPNDNSDCEFIIAIGDNSIREKIAHRLNANYGNAIHQRAIISSTAVLGHGLAVMAGAVINAQTTVGNHAIINTNASIDHDCIIGDFVHIAPSATLCGGVQVGKGTLIGAGSIIIPNIVIGKNVVIGAGSVITEDIADGMTIVGHNKRIKNE